MVSVIVPVYNVEKYLRQCLDSLKAQTLKDTEFIIIDDGSTDSSGQICDEYGNDPRFRIIHTENRGLSAARNRGIDECNGEWIMFVDSDDWLEPGFCEIPLRVALENNADLVIFQSAWTTEQGKIKKKKRIDKPTGTVTHEQTIDYGRPVAWNKLYRNTLFADIRYPEGHVYEDVATTHKLVYGASNIQMLDDILYYHRKRKGSITLRKTPDSERDRFSFRIQRYQDLVGLGYHERKEKERLQTSAFMYCVRIKPSDEELFVKATQIVAGISFVPDDWTLKIRILFIIWKKNQPFFHFLCRLLKKKLVM